MRPLSSSTNVNTNKQTNANDVTEESPLMSREELDKSPPEPDEPKKEEKVYVLLATNLPYIVYCLSQMIFLAGFLTGQLYIVPFAQKEV